MKNCKFKRKSTAAMLALLFASVVPTSVLAVDTSPGTFELDGNAMDETVAGDDWSTLYPNGKAGVVFSFVVDRNGPDDIFTGGGSKTPNPIGEWQWKTSPPPPDKTNITNAYAANYRVDGDQIVYFGADLFSENGDAELAFWFFQDRVQKLSDGSFEGEHVDSDPYVAVKFANGGRDARIAVYEWWSACAKDDRTPAVVGSCAASNIRIRIPEADATCDGSGGKLACAISNLNEEVSPWPYTPKSGTANKFPPTTFFEGGINISEIFGTSLCFSSFAVTSGASTSFTSTAKDFALGEFNVCAVSASKTCVNDSELDDEVGAITYNVRGCATNDGAGDIYITSLLNSIGGDPNYTPSDLVWYRPGQVGEPARDFDPETDCNNPGYLKEAVDNGALVANLATEEVGPGEALIYQFSETSSVSAPTDRVTIDAEGTDGADVRADTAEAICPDRTFNAALTVNKQCAANLEATGGNVVVKIGVQGIVCNTGEVTLTNLTLDDVYEAGTLVSVTPISTTLAPQGQEGACTTYSGSHYPSQIPTGNICPFSDTVKVYAQAPGGSIGGQCDATGLCTAESNMATCNLRALDDDNDCATGPLSVLP